MNDNDSEEIRGRGDGTVYCGADGAGCGTRRR